jgi:small subunit ribosomal protein S35
LLWFEQVLTSSSDLTKPFTPPTAATPLRFRYTTYMGEQHPAQRKVVVEFDPSDLSLDPTHTQNLIKLAGVRYNPTSKIVKMSCEDHETQAQNKRHLGDTIKALIAKAKAPESQWLKDVPVDFRHAKPKKRFQFPDEWLLTEERKKELEARREARQIAEQTKKESPAGLIDGIKEIEEARNIDLSKVEAPLMAEAKMPMAKGKQGKKEMRQGRA